MRKHLHANSGSFVDGSDTYLMVKDGEVKLRYARDLKVADKPLPMVK